MKSKSLFKITTLSRSYVTYFILPLKNNFVRMKANTTKKALFTLLLMICTVSFSVSNANNLSTLNDSIFSDTAFIANFSYNNLGDGNVAFTDISWADELSGDTITSWYWNFGDSTDSYLQNPTHTYASGVISATVCLTVYTTFGNSCTTCKNVPVSEDIIVTCPADFSYTSNQIGTVSFYNQSQVDSSQAICTWEFGDGTTSYQFNPIHTYDSNITEAYVCLNIITPQDSCATCKMIYINSQNSCQADFIYEPAVSVVPDSGTTLYFQDVSTPQNDIAWRQWNISDSTQYTDKNFIHVFDPSLTEATVWLYIGTYSGCQSQIYKTIDLTDTIPYDYCKADFSYIAIKDSLSMGPLPRYKVYFDDLSYSSDTIISWLWLFGDGTYSTEQNPSPVYINGLDTVYVSLIIQSNNGCTDSISKLIYLHEIPGLYSMSGIVQGKDELLPQGIIVLYKKADNGFFMLHDANIVNNGIFSFNQLNTGKYILYAMPHMYLTDKYYPTYYVNKLHWANAYVIDLHSDIGGLTLQMVSTRMLERGNGRISGTVVNIINQTGQLKNTRLKDIINEVSTPVYLYSPSGEVLDMSLIDESNAFSFEALPYGTYVLEIESLNLPSYKIAVTLSPETPEISDVLFDLNNPVGMKDNIQVSNLTVRSFDENSIGITITQGGGYNLTITNLSGKILFAREINIEANIENIISVGSIPGGIYILKLQNTANMEVVKFLK